ncbi:MAG: transcriptional regulator TrmB [Parcubacteria group bacterium]|nr:transcriptional regulator TrmB [Parcubacteria group bacterium]
MSESIDEIKLTSSLESLGLSTKETKVYLDLLSRSQPVGTSKIVRATGLHGQFVYNALEGLEEKGLATHVVVGTRKRFGATSPSRLELLAERKRQLAKETAHQLEMLHRMNHFQDFEFFQGEDAFIAHEFNELQEATDGEEWLIIGGSGDKFTAILGNSLREYDSQRSQKRIGIRYLGSAIQRVELIALSKARPGFDARIIENFGESIVNTLVRPGSLSLSTYGDPILTYSVKNAQVAQSYRNFFESLWALSKT